MKKSLLYAGLAVVLCLPLATSAQTLPQNTGNDLHVASSGNSVTVPEPAGMLLLGLGLLGIGCVVPRKRRK